MAGKFAGKKRRAGPRFEEKRQQPFPEFSFYHPIEMYGIIGELNMAVLAGLYGSIGLMSLLARYFQRYRKNVITDSWYR